MSRPASFSGSPTSRANSLGRETTPLIRPSMRSQNSFTSTGRRSMLATANDNQSHNDRDMAQVVCGSFFNLTLGLAGMQFIWTVELGYGTPYLISLGMSKDLLPLVWTAGPLSGLLIQPMVGAYSDVSTHRWGRRRPYILLGSILVLIAVFMVAHAQWIASHCLALWSRAFKPSDNDSDTLNQVAIGIAVLGFFVLDFSINAVQACLRALVVDIASLDSQSRANAWASRMLGIGSVIGYFVGYLDLVLLFPELGNTQMEVLCAVGSIVFVICVGWTCLMVWEERYERGIDVEQPHWYKPLLDVFHAFWHLPDPVQRVCTTQFFAWMAWFPFLFYSTTWIIEILMRDHLPTEPGFIDAATRAGSFALLLNALISLFSSIFLPLFTAQAQKMANYRRHYLSHRESFGLIRRSFEAILDTVIASWRLRGVWVISNLFFSLLLFSTWFARDVYEATIIIALCGIPWAIVMWVPFAMVGEYLNVTNEEQDIIDYTPSDTAANYSASASASASPLASGPNSPASVSSASLFRKGSAVLSIHRNEDTAMEANRQTAVKLETGTALGIINIYVVLPQFVSTLVSSIIFTALSDPNTIDHRDGDDIGFGKDREVVGWVLRFGGICALMAAIMASRCVQYDAHHRS
ncbi:major facilitator superfamily domain-containing protein [Syncephalis plumigaleata]|nr:major facilitator superfamily domain-containing protein [Syncephalis plumigaleata]